MMFSSRAFDRIRVKPTLAAVVVFAAVGSVNAAPIVSNVGVLPGGDYSYAEAISANGTAVAGYGNIPGFNRAFRWTSATGIQNIGSPGDIYSYGYGISLDGTAITGTRVNREIDPNQNDMAFRWTSAGGLVNLGSLAPANGQSFGLGISADGQAITGFSSGSPSGFHAFRWTLAEGMTDLGTLAPNTSDGQSFGNAISGNGLAVTGYSQSPAGDRAFRWISGTMQDLGVLPGSLSSEGFGISADGSVVVGVSRPGSGLIRAFRWTQSGGMQELGLPPGSNDRAQATAVSGDGLVVVGYTSGGDATAFVWTQQLGSLNLRDYLVANCVDVTGWNFRIARGVSADGSAIVGEGFFFGAPRAWIVTGLSFGATGACCLGVDCAVTTEGCCSGQVGTTRRIFQGPGTVCNAPGAPPFTNDLIPCCRADFDRNGTRAPSDIFAFLNNYFSADATHKATTDSNGSGTSEPSDIFAFLNIYFAGGC